MTVGIELEKSLACNWNIEQFKSLFNIINEEYTKYCKQWIENSTIEINLNKKCICDIYSSEKGIDKKFKEYMDSFMDGLVIFNLNLVCEINKLGLGPVFRTRIKDPQSILDKINKKSKTKSGKYPIIKCLNDLFGIRVVDNNYKDNIENIKEILENVEYKIRHMDRIKEMYKGHHVYFKQNTNIYFPIELQIWDSENEHSNYESHKIYKEDYISWTEEYKKT